MLFFIRSHTWLAIQMLLLAGMTTVAYILVSGRAEKSYLYLKIREFVLNNGLTDWLTVGFGTLLTLLILYFCGLFWSALAMAVLAVLIAYGLHYGFDRPLRAQRRAPVAKMEQVLKGMRLRGMEEEKLQQFVCEYSGERWEGFFETLFGYEAKLQARERWGRDRQNRPRPKAAGWRDPVIKWIDARQRARREAREKKLLLAIQQKELQARGLSAAEAKEQAEGMADALVGHAAAFKRSSRRRGADEPVPQAAFKLDFDSFHKPKRKTLGQRVAQILHIALGPQLRFLAGALLVAGCLGWMDQNNMIPWQQIKEVGTQALDIRSQKMEVKDQDLEKAKVTVPDETKPLRLPAVPAALTEGFDSFNPGIAGLLLLFAALFPGTLVGASAFLGALVICAGQRLGIPSYELKHLNLPTAAAGLALAIAGFMLDSRRAEG
jgi:hypothetical protein